MVVLWMDLMEFFLGVDGWESGFGGVGVEVGVGEAVGGGGGRGGEEEEGGDGYCWGGGVGGRNGE